MVLRCVQRLSWWFEKTDALILLSFANALFYEENFEENHKREEKRGKRRKSASISNRIESIRWNERETRRMARVVVKKELDVFIFYFALRNQSCCNRALSFFFFFFSSSISRSSFRRDLSLSLSLSLKLFLSLSLSLARVAIYSN